MSALLVGLVVLVLVVSLVVFVPSFVPLNRSERPSMMLLLALFVAGLSLLAGALVVLLLGEGG